MMWRLLNRVRSNVSIAKYMSALVLVRTRPMLCQKLQVERQETLRTAVYRDLSSQMQRHKSFRAQRCYEAGILAEGRGSSTVARGENKYRRSQNRTVEKDDLDHRQNSVLPLSTVFTSKTVPSLRLAICERPHM